MPVRIYKSVCVEDFESFFGIDRMKIIKGNKDIKFYVTEVLYQMEGDTPDKTQEIYFHFDGFCFTKKISSKLATVKIIIKDLENLSVDEKYSEECNK